MNPLNVNQIILILFCLVCQDCQAVELQSQGENRSVLVEYIEKNWEMKCKNNLIAAEQFLEKISLESSVKTIIEKQLYYKVEEEGSGAKVSDADAIVEIEYKVYEIVDQKENFTSESTDPVKVDLKLTIPGFSKGVLGMQLGEKRRIYIHPDLAYGTTGFCEPNIVMLYDVKLIEILENR
jgi:peptidylprolyl isomerase